MGKTYDFNTADTLNTLLLNCIFASGQLKEGEMYDVDFDHQFIETEKYDADPNYHIIITILLVFNNTLTGLSHKCYQALILISVHLHQKLKQNHYERK